MVRIISSYFFVISSIIISSFSVVSAMYFCLFIVVRLQVPIQVYSQMSPWFMIFLVMFLSSQRILFSTVDPALLHQRRCRSVVCATCLFICPLLHRHLFHSKNICPPPLPYFKVNICPLPLPLNIFRLFVILSLTQLYRYTPEIFLFSTATFKYTYRDPLRRIGQDYSAKVAWWKFNSLKRIQPLPVCAGFFICIRNSLDRPCVTMSSWSSPLKCKVSL